MFNRQVYKIKLTRVVLLAQSTVDFIDDSACKQSCLHGCVFVCPIYFCFIDVLVNCTYLGNSGIFDIV